MGTIQKAKYFQIVEYTFFLSLCGLSVFLMYGVLDKFIAGKTSISQSEKSLKELPSITMCFSKPDARITEYEHELDFTIQYGIIDRKLEDHFIYLKEGENSNLFDETIYLDKIITLRDGHCYNLQSVLNNKYMVKEVTQISIYFNESTTEEGIPPFLKVFITSENNSHGVVWSNWKNGKVMETQIDKGMEKVVDLKPIQHSYLTTNSKCSYESLYECVSRYVAEYLKGSSSQCSTLSLTSYPICKIDKTKEETDEFTNALENGTLILQTLSTILKN